MDACSCSITKSSSKKKSLDKVACRNSTRSSMDNFNRCSVNHTHRSDLLFGSWTPLLSLCGVNSLTLVQFEDGVGHGRQQSFTLQDVDVPDPEGEGEGSLETNRTEGQEIISLVSLKASCGLIKCFSSLCPEAIRLVLHIDHIKHGRSFHDVIHSFQKSHCEAQ